MTDTAWIIIGRYENWVTALNQPIPLWGLKPSYRGEFEGLRPGSLAWIYVTNPVGGVVGLALIREKYIDEDTPLWPEELQKRRVIWPLRFRLEIVRMLPPNRWQKHAVPIHDFSLFMQKGFQRLTAAQHRVLIERFQQVLGLPSAAPLDAGATVWSPVSAEARHETSLSLHRDLQELLAEMGRLQHYHSQLEFPLGEGNDSLDVVWRREMSGVPTIAFEVELSASVEQALARLRIAHERWATRPCIVLGGDDPERIQSVLAQHSHRFAELVRVCSEEQVRKVHTLKRELRSLEESLGIY